MKTKRLFFVIFLFLFCITGCITPFDRNDQTTEESENDFPPTVPGFIKIEGVRHEMEPGNYRWERKKGLETEAVTTDAASPFQIGEGFEAIEVKPGADITIEIKDKPKLSVFPWNRDGSGKEIILENNRLSAPSSKGRYIYEVLAKWSNGEISYTFVVKVN
ncbi:hypothetical protein [Fictibacillus sp. 18YEL24]|uniref:hypothetical protein n=1 Tax=Fictibacillus sp. 18YEL24 TaxID=2745875 RepID=UPI0018CF06AE|nr:hypothetical protein [Fictibacillus sp. 18YEL24]MBH0168269.1 hypothetical protein [Fictibacillus sp. 18YEL24]